jgi:hypothetical protein
VDGQPATDRFDAARLVVHTVRAGGRGGLFQDGSSLVAGACVGEQDVSVGGVQAYSLQWRRGGGTGSGQLDVPQRDVQVAGATVGERDFLLGDRPVLGLGEGVEGFAGGGHDLAGLVVVALFVEGGADPQQRPRAVAVVEALVVGEVLVAADGDVEVTGHLVDDRE